MWSSDKYNSTPLDRFTLLIPYCLDFIKCMHSSINLSYLQMFVFSAERIKPTIFSLFHSRSTIQPTLYLFSFNWEPNLDDDKGFFVSGDVIYDAESPNTAPDVIFSPEDDDFHPFHMFPSSSEPANNCLSDWNYKDPTRLLTLIQYLRSFFFFFLLQFLVVVVLFWHSFFLLPLQGSICALSEEARRRSWRWPVNIRSQHYLVQGGNLISILLFFICWQCSEILVSMVNFISWLPRVTGVRGGESNPLQWRKVTYEDLTFYSFKLSIYNGNCW